jgi:hypothetical protein
VRDATGGIALEFAPLIRNVGDVLAIIASDFDEPDGCAHTDRHVLDVYLHDRDRLDGAGAEPTMTTFRFLWRGGAHRARLRSRYCSHLMRELVC